MDPWLGRTPTQAKALSWPQGAGVLWHNEGVRRAPDLGPVPWIMCRDSGADSRLCRQTGIDDGLQPNK